MILYSIENDFLKVVITSKGAELQSVLTKENQLEYLWQANEKFWAKRSPVLFPIVGGLKNNSYSYQNKTFNLSRHGFARENEFSILKTTETSIQFLLENSEKTLLVFPFQFKFIIEYALQSSKLICNYLVENLSDDEMYFSVGAHPAFNVPLSDSTIFSDWILEFNQPETIGIFPLTADGLLKAQPIPFLQNSNQIKLTKDLFYKDALVFKHLQSNQLKLISNKSQHGIKMQFDGFPFFGIWSAKDADFICLEPWCGVADSENNTGEITQKEGINILKSNETFSRTWSIELF